MRHLYSLPLLLLSFSLKALAVDLQPNDVVAPQPDRINATISYFGTQNSTFYLNGTKLTNGPYANPVIDSQAAIFRLAGTYSVFGLPGASYAQLPYGTLQPGGSLGNYSSSTGLGDTTLATAIWPYANQATGTYFAVAGYLGLPTGAYSNNQVFNLGEHRYKSDIQVGFQTPIINKIDGMIAVDTTWFGGNSQCAAACLSTNAVSLNQKPLTTTQLGPIYNINPTFTLAASYLYVAGGALSINNVYQNNVINTQRFLLSAVAHTEIGRFSLQFGRDVEVKNGFMQNQLLALRYLKSF